MNFYQAQDQARGRTRLLALLFLLLNLGLILLVNLLFAWYLWVNDDLVTAVDRVFFDYLSWQRLLIVGCGVFLLLLFAAWLKWLDVSRGGGSVAEALGGERVAYAMPDHLQRRLLNVVEEIALAAGMPVPPVYVMRREKGINAFAAGLGLSDAAICVTRGALEGLDRDQLQGVIAHEFSHILNGDMRLNMRLMVVLHGMVFFAELGQEFINSRTSWWVDATKSRSSSRGYLILLGLGLIVIGWCGVLLGNIIKAAISRQREFLADASAVQFTRNPEGIAGALKVIGGSAFQGTVQHPGSREASHLFFSAVAPRQLFASHPLLVKRILRIDPKWDGEYLEPLSAPAPPVFEDRVEQRKAKSSAAVIDSLIGTLAGAELMSDSARQVAQPETASHVETLVAAGSLIKLARDPYDARVLLLGLLLAPEAQLRQQQMLLISSVDQTLTEQLEHFQKEIDALPRAQHLTLIEIALPALKAQSGAQYKLFKRLLIRVIQADSQIDLYEWVLYQLVSRYCDAHFCIGRGSEVRASKIKYRKLAPLGGPYAIVLSALAHHGCGDADSRQKAFNIGANSTGLYTLKLLPEAQCGRKAFSAAVSELALATPFIKQRLLKGLVQAVCHDDVVNPLEKELVTAVAAVMESPLLGLDDD